jgi:hypothetical protein
MREFFNTAQSLRISELRFKNYSSDERVDSSALPRYTEFFGKVGAYMRYRLYFHAQFRRVNPLPYKENYVILDNIKGNGHYVGTYMHWGVKSNRWWGEGEIKFYIDGDKEFPTVCGTGTEDYFCGAYNFDVNGEFVEYTTPYAGMYKVGSTDRLYRSQLYFDMYRWHITDPVYFKEDLKVTVQALGWRRDGRYLPLKDDISSVAYWYQDKPAANFPKFPSTDELELI